MPGLWKAENIFSFALHRSYEIGIIILILPIRKLKLRKKVKSLGQCLILSKWGFQDQVGLMSKHVFIPIPGIASPGFYILDKNFAR